MARIKPIDVIKGISGKYGSGTNDYFATNEQYEPRRGDHWRLRNNSAAKSPPGSNQSSRARQSI